MGISTNIDGSTVSGADNVLSLISLISDPVAYKARIDELNAATEENRKFIELIAPAQDIVVLRSKLAAELADAVDATKTAKVDADVLVRDAKAAADGIVSDAKAKAATIIADADAIKAANDSSAKELAKELSDARADRAALSKAAKEASDARDAADAEKAAASTERAAFAADREAIIAKHKAFIESLA